MKEIERIADSEGLSYRQMMENAGTAAFEVMRQNWPDAERIVIFVGKGNNGGDGFVAARLYEAAGARAAVILCEGEPKTVDAEYNYEKIRQLENVEIIGLEELQIGGARDHAGEARQEKSETQMEGNGEAAAELIQADLIVDALYGTGFHGELRESGRKAAELINGSSAPVCALDLPSGMNADTGETADGAVKADLTVAFHRKKHGHDAENAEEYCGKIVVVPIGIDA